MAVVTNAAVASDAAKERAICMPRIVALPRAGTAVATGLGVAALGAGLVYTSDSGPGITRLRRGRGFVYAFSSGRRVRDPRQLGRIRSLAIPPAWTDVWICNNANGHIQATGRDARGRKQYRYHARWTAVRSQTKYARMTAFGLAMPALRARAKLDLAQPRLNREKVLALVVQLLEKTNIRVGNEEYRRANGSYGLTTLRATHVSVAGSRVRFRFRGKSGKLHDVGFSDPRLARLIRNCQELPGSQLFQYVDADGAVQDIGSSDVNAYLRAAMSDDFTAKDFRTWSGSVAAAGVLASQPVPASKRECARQVVAAIDEVASMLNNTRAVCRSSYIHPVVVSAHERGELTWAEVNRTRPRRGLSRLETFVLALISRSAGAASPKAA
jgi:DNA topoisomerase-1